MLLLIEMVDTAEEEKVLRAGIILCSRRKQRALDGFLLLSACRAKVGVAATVCICNCSPDLGSRTRKS